MFSLSGKCALVTGASGGIGAAIATSLHAQGATVALSGIAKRIVPGCDAVSIATPEDVGGFVLS